MGSSSREEIVEVFDALDAEVDRLCELTFDAFTTPERLRALERLEQVARRLPVAQHALINQLDAQASDEELGGKLRFALANRLRITKAEAGRRIVEAADLGERRALTGERLAPQLTATAAAQRQGLIGEGHMREIRKVHHVQGWATTGRTDIDDLTLACGPDNRLIEKGWTTRNNAQGDTEWIPPAHLDHGQPRTNPYHHPERFLRNEDDEPG